MKKVFLSFIGCLALIITGHLWGACSQSRYYCQNQSQPTPEYCSSCNCADPACMATNDCMSRSECCRAFGNIGSAE